mgnify:FL=1
MPNKYLPIGSVVKLKGNDKKIMIIGYYSLEYNNAVRIYDYVGCSYPEGLLIKNNSYSFNHSDISSVVFNGYIDESFNKLNTNLKDEPSDDKNLETKSSFINVKFDENGVVVYDELSPVKEDNSIIEDSISNPFNSKEVKESIEKIPFVDLELSNLLDVKKDDKVISDTKEIESKFKFTFDKSGVVTNEVAVEIPKVDDTNLKESKLIYEFDENGIVIGVKNQEEKESTSNYNFDQNGFVTNTEPKKSETEEFDIPHYTFDENGVILN